MKWMAKGEIPNKPGWYWLRRKEKSYNVWLVQIKYSEQIQDHLLIRHENKDDWDELLSYKASFCPHCNGILTPKEMLYQFAGPIPKPEKEKS